MRDFTMDLFIGALWVLALARVTRLLTTDEITDFLRIWVYRVFGHQSKMGYFATCPWCVSLWLSFLSLWTVFLITDTDWRLYPFAAFAGSYLVGLLASNFEGDDDADVEILED